MHELRLALDALIEESTHDSYPQLTSMIAAVAAVIHRNGDVHHIFEYEAISFGQNLAAKKSDAACIEDVCLV
jgi:hypothetical protein